MSSSSVVVVSAVECMFLKQHVKYVQLVVLQQHSLFVLIALLRVLLHTPVYFQDCLTCIPAVLYMYT